jgi:hypothetical protein
MDVQIDCHSGRDAYQPHFLAKFCAVSEMPSSQGQLLSILGQVGDESVPPMVDDGSGASGTADKDLQPLSIADNGCRQQRAKGLEPSTSSLGS